MKRFQGKSGHCLYNYDGSVDAVNQTLVFRWHTYKLVSGSSSLPMTWPGPKQAPPLPDCSSDASCKVTCSGYASCPIDGEWYCCEDTLHCTGQHLCSGMAWRIGGQVNDEFDLFP